MENSVLEGDYLHTNPKPDVSFVVPCYNLGHLLSECVHSILSQTYENFEIIIMDDCSPDKTPEIAKLFKDARVHYIRNDKNLGHLKNYNKGIGLSRGKYVWLISADDRLRVPYLLERYVKFMDNNSSVGYVCCSTIRLEKGVETIVENCLAKDDKIFKGKEFLSRLLKGNCIEAPTGMVRRTCYEQFGTFPVDLPYSGDWFLWCLFAIHFDVAYFAEPMVNYRRHELSMTNYLMDNHTASAVREGFTVIRRIQKHAKHIGDFKIADKCRFRLARLYGLHLAGGKYEGRSFRLSEDEFENYLSQDTINQEEKNWMKAKAMEAAGDFSCLSQNYKDAREYYKRASMYNPWMLGTRIRQILCKNQFILGLGINLGFKVFKFKRSVLG